MSGENFTSFFVNGRDLVVIDYEKYSYELVDNSDAELMHLPNAPH